MWLTFGNNVNGIRCLVLFVFTALLLQMPAGSAAERYEGESCELKSTKPGVCTVVSKCTTLKNALKTREILAADIIRCSFGVREEIICCPIGEASTDIVEESSTTVANRDFLTTSTTAANPDFWSNLLTTTTTTTAKPDFWLYLLNTTTTTTTTTTLKPLMIGDTELDIGSQFFDFSKLLTGKNANANANNIQGATHQQLNNDPRHGRDTSPGAAQDSQWGWSQNNERNTDPRSQIPTQWNQPANLGRPNHQAGHNGNAFGHGNNGHGNDRINRNNGRNVEQQWNQRQNRPGQFNQHANQFSGNLANGFRNNGRGNGREQEQQLQRPGNGNNRNNIAFFPSNGIQTPQWLANNDVELINPQSPNILSNQVETPHTNGLPMEQFPANNNQWVLNNNNVEVFNKGTGTNQATNAALIRPVDNFDVTNTNHLGSFSNPTATHSLPNNIANAKNVKLEADPITMIYDNLVNSGMDIVKAKLDMIDRSWERQQQQFGNAGFPQNTPPPTTTAASLWDPFAPFQFRPQQTDSQDFNGVGFDQFNAGINSVVNNPALSVNQRPPITTTTTTTTTTTIAPVTTRSTDRPCVEACRRFEVNLTLELTPHILNGIPVELGEYPHMVAIGFTNIGSEDGAYDFRCGGTLIESRFVLTAAHCVNSLSNQPAMVRMGVVDFNNLKEMQNAVEIPIRKVHIHPDFSGASKYNDIAILELEREVAFSDRVKPTCLYTNVTDLPPESILYVTGWGTVNLRTRQTSNRLLKAKLESVPLSTCNDSYVEMGLTRQIARGVLETQLCAYDNSNERDACQGDSGGPLNLVLDESRFQYRVVGVVSVGFSCGSATPGLYSRVASYLDYIEGIVWPNGG